MFPNTPTKAADNLSELLCALQMFALGAVLALASSSLKAKTAVWVLLAGWWFESTAYARRVTPLRFLSLLLGYYDHSSSRHIAVMFYLDFYRYTDFAFLIRGLHYLYLMFFYLLIRQFT